MEVKNDIIIKNIKFYILSKANDIYMKGELYIGKSEDINTRFSSHYNNFDKKNEKVYKYIRENGGFDNFVMTIINEHVYMGTEKQIRVLVATQERLYIDEYNATLNTSRPIISNKERLELCRKRNEYNYKNDPEWRDKKIAKIKIRENFKYQNDPEFRDKKLSQNKIRQKFKYQNDPEYRNKLKAKSKEYYNNKKK